MLAPFWGLGRGWWGLGKRVYFQQKTSQLWLGFLHHSYESEPEYITIDNLALTAWNHPMQFPANIPVWQNYCVSGMMRPFWDVWRLTSQNIKTCVRSFLVHETQLTCHCYSICSKLFKKASSPGQAFCHCSRRNRTRESWLLFQHKTTARYWMLAENSLKWITTFWNLASLN